MSPENPNQNFSNLVALFLSEAIRTRRTSLPRAAEISQRVISSLEKLNSETGALSLLTDIEKDFEEVTVLKQALHFGHETSDVKVYETEIKEYASRIFLRDLQLSSVFLQDSAAPNMTIQKLCVKYPDFCNFLLSTSEKAVLLPQFQN